MIYKVLGHAQPWLYISAYYETYRDEYMACLYEISSRGDWEKWIEFCLRGTVEQANDSIQRCHKFNLLRKELHERVGPSTARTYAMIESLFRTPAVTIPVVSKQFGTAYHTAQGDIERLVKAKILREVAGKYPRTFFAPEIMKIAYDIEDDSTYHDSKS
jgi:Fic family protein